MFEYFGCICLILVFELVFVLFAYFCWIWFCFKVFVVRTYVIHLLGTYVTISCNWLIL